MMEYTHYCDSSNFIPIPSDLYIILKNLIFSICDNCFLTIKPSCLNFSLGYFPNMIRYTYKKISLEWARLILKEQVNTYDEISTHRYFISRYSSIPNLEPSRPNPDCLTPPNGATSLEMAPVLIPTIPYSKASPTRH